jgi:hypothetical protein
MANARAGVGCLPLPLQALTCSGSQDDQPLTMDEPDEFLPSCPISDIMSFWLRGPRSHVSSHRATNNARLVENCIHSWRCADKRIEQITAWGASQRQMMWNHKSSCCRVLENVCVINL